MPKKLTDLVLEEVSLVDTPANQHSKVLLFKRYADEFEKLAALIVKTEPQEFADLLAVQEAEEAVFELGSELFGKIRVLQDSLASILESDATDKAQMIQRSLAQFQDALEADLPSASDLTKALMSPPDKTPTIEKESVMDLETQVAELSEQVAELEKKAETAEAEKAEAVEAKDKAERVAALTGSEKAHYDNLDELDAAAFLAKSEDDRAADIKKAAEADEVFEYDGATIRKSDVGEGQFAIFKKMAADRQADQERLDKALEENQLVAFGKRAETELGKLPGEVDAKAKALKALDGVDADAREAIETMLKAGNAAMETQLTVIGKDSVPDADSGEGKLDSLVKAYAEKNSVSIAKATDEVLNTAEGQAAYRQHKLEKQAAANG